MEVFSLPRVQGVFDFLAVTELFLSDTEELATITTGLWHRCGRIVHHSEIDAALLLYVHETPQAVTNVSNVSHLTKPTSSQLTLASNSLAEEEHTWRHLLWVESKTLRCWSAELT